MTTWTKELLKNLDAHVDEPTKKIILGACGEKCPFTHLTDKKLLEIRQNSKNEIDFLESLCQEWRLKNENGQYYVVFDQCYCPMVNGDIRGTSKSLCYCTLGNLKHKFKIGFGRDIDVKMQKTILAGDNECRFQIQIENVSSM